MARSQFTFYESFYKAVSRIKKAQDRAAAYDMICAYALYQTEPDLDKAPDSVAIAFDLLRPVLDKAKEKAENGKKGGSKQEANGKQTESKTEANRKLGNIPSKKEKEGEKEKEKEKEKEIEIDNISPLIVPNPKTTQWEVTCTAPAPHEPPPCPPQDLGCYTRPVGNDGKEAYGVRQLVRLKQSEYDRLILEFGEMNVMTAIAQMGKWLMETPAEERPKEHYPVLRKKLRKEPLLRDNGP